MARSTGAAFIGVSLAGVGVLLLFATWKNKKVFGSGGLLTQAIQTGKIPGFGSVPAAYGGFGSETQFSTSDGTFPSNSNPTSPQGHDYRISPGNDLYNAIIDIADHNYTLAEQITTDTSEYTFTKSGTAKAAIENDITMVNGMGLTNDANTIKSWLESQ